MWCEGQPEVAVRVIFCILTCMFHVAAWYSDVCVYHVAAWRGMVWHVRRGVVRRVYDGVRGAVQPCRTTPLRTERLPTGLELRRTAHTMQTGALCS